MPKTYNVAHQFAINHTRNLARKFRGYAVSDFAPYKELHIFPSRENIQTYNEAYALYTYWCHLSGSNSAYRAPSGGKPFLGNERQRKFKYIPNANPRMAPACRMDDGTPLVAGERRTVLLGVGQCNYFAQEAYNALKAIRLPNRTPEVKKISTPGHNWVVVNSNAPLNDQVGVDLWMYAFGAPLASIAGNNGSIGRLTHARFGSVYQTVATSTEI